jgi:hypothetical protein
LILEINNNDRRLHPHLLTLAQLAAHYRCRELSADNLWKTYSTKAAYEIYLNRWIVPKWGEYQLGRIKPIEVETWLRQLPLARATCAKIRNIMSVLFNHARRYDLFRDNPIQLVRKVPSVGRCRTSLFQEKFDSSWMQLIHYRGC